MRRVLDEAAGLDLEPLLVAQQVDALPRRARHAVAMHVPVARAGAAGNADAGDAAPHATATA